MKASGTLLKVVGFSAAGKSTLVAALRKRGYNARAASQEHSQIPDMWRKLHPPDILIFLSLELEQQGIRRPDVSWSRGWYTTEQCRLQHARIHADLYIDTSNLSSDQVLWQVMEHLSQLGIEPGAPLPPNPPTGGFIA